MKNYNNMQESNTRDWTKPDKKDHEEIKQKEGLKGIELDGLFIA